ncbi:hypothetical protein EBU71_13725 [bacterium]|nr:hypothetical protein [Candidatus Elulimicrobium humile]
MDKVDKIFISLAAYRDPDLINTVKSFYDNAEYKDRLFFSLVSHEGSETNFDFSFIPSDQINYNKIDYRLADGACSGRHLANSLLSKNYKYFLHTDSHSRAKENWDLLLIDCYNKCKVKWGENYIFTKYPHGFLINWDENGIGTDKINYENETLNKVVPEWCDVEHLYLLRWRDLEDLEYGDKTYGFCANFAFGSSESFLKAPYDPYMYFLGEEITLGIRLTLNGVNLVAPPINAIWTNYDRDNGKRNFHWIDSKVWGARDKAARYRVNDLFHGKDLGVYGIQDKMLEFKELQKEMGLDFENKIHIKPLYLN